VGSDAQLAQVGPCVHDKRFGLWPGLVSADNMTLVFTFIVVMTCDTLVNTDRQTDGMRTVYND